MVLSLTENSTQLYKFVRTSQDTSPVRAQQVNAIYIFVTVVY
jgi:hypothetical protein